MSVQTTYSDLQKAAFAGLLADGGKHDIMSMVNAEASAGMPFGTAVAFKSGNTTDQDALVPAGSSDKIAGLVVFSDAYQRTYQIANPDGTTSTVGDLGSTGLLPGVELNILRRGRLWITTVTACAPGDRGYISYNGTGTATAAGLVAQASDAGHTIDLTSSIVYLTTAIAGGLAIVEVDFTNKP